jgi:aminoglycoside 6'-N-acetyltransferase
MRADDVEHLERWDEDPDVAASGGGDDWPFELSRGEFAWRESLIAEENGRPVGFVQLIDAREEESHYWVTTCPRAPGRSTSGSARRKIGAEVSAAR